jgi:hypothetical protein
VGWWRGSSGRGGAGSRGCFRRRAMTTTRGRSARDDGRAGSPPKHKTIRDVLLFFDLFFFREIRSVFLFKKGFFLFWFVEWLLFSVCA